MFEPSFNGTMKDYTVLRQLGQGAMGSVHLVSRNIDGTLLALKSVAISKASDRALALNEVEILRRLEHPGVVRFDGYFSRGESLCILMQFCDEGDLFGLLSDQRSTGKRLRESQVRSMLRQLADALAHCHAQRVVHRDIKSSNIFLAQGGKVLLGDFGVAKALESTRAMACTQCGTPYYLPPEVCNGAPYSYKADVWSLGVLAYEMIALRYPYTAESLPALVMKIVNGKKAPLSNFISSELRSCIDNMLQQRPKDRPRASDLGRVISAAAPSGSRRTSEVPQSCSRRPSCEGLPSVGAVPPHSTLRGAGATAASEKRQQREQQLIEAYQPQGEKSLTSKRRKAALPPEAKTAAAKSPAAKGLTQAARRPGSSQPASDRMRPFSQPASDRMQQPQPPPSHPTKSPTRPAGDVPPMKSSPPRAAGEAPAMRPSPPRPVADGSSRPPPPSPAAGGHAHRRHTKQHAKSAGPRPQSAGAAAPGGGKPAPPVPDAKELLAEYHDRKEAAARQPGQRWSARPPLTSAPLSPPTGSSTSGWGGGAVAQGASGKDPFGASNRDEEREEAVASGSDRDQVIGSPFREDETYFGGRTTRRASKGSKSSSNQSSRCGSELSSPIDGVNSGQSAPAAPTVAAATMGASAPTRTAAAAMAPPEEQPRTSEPLTPRKVWNAASTAWRNGVATAVRATSPRSSPRESQQQQAPPTATSRPATATATSRPSTAASRARAAKARGDTFQSAAQPMIPFELALPGQSGMARPDGVPAGQVAWARAGPPPRRAEPNPTPRLDEQLLCAYEERLRNLDGEGKGDALGVATVMGAEESSGEMWYGMHPIPAPPPPPPVVVSSPDQSSVESGTLRGESGSLSERARWMAGSDTAYRRRVEEQIRERMLSSGSSAGQPEEISVSPLPPPSAKTFALSPSLRGGVPPGASPDRPAPKGKWWAGQPSPEARPGCLAATAAEAASGAAPEELLLEGSDDEAEKEDVDPDLVSTDFMDRLLNQPWQPPPDVDELATPETTPPLTPPKYDEQLAATKPAALLERVLGDYGAAAVAATTLVGKTVVPRVEASDSSRAESTKISLDASQTRVKTRRGAAKAVSQGLSSIKVGFMRILAPRKTPRGTPRDKTPRDGPPSRQNSNRDGTPVFLNPVSHTVSHTVAHTVSHTVADPVYACNDSMSLRSEVNGSLRV